GVVDEARGARRARRRGIRAVPDPQRELQHARQRAVHGRLRARLRFALRARAARASRRRRALPRPRGVRLPATPRRRRRLLRDPLRACSWLRATGGARARPPGARAPARGARGARQRRRLRPFQSRLRALADDLAQTLERAQARPDRRARMAHAPSLVPALARARPAGAPLLWTTRRGAPRRARAAALRAAARARLGHGFARVRRPLRLARAAAPPTRPSPCGCAAALRRLLGARARRRSRDRVHELERRRQP